MAEADTDLELKKRARRRLVGAVVLAILAAVLLPIMMDQTPPPALSDIQVQIPPANLVQSLGAQTTKPDATQAGEDEKPAAKAAPKPQATPEKTAPITVVENMQKPAAPAASAAPRASAPAASANQSKSAWIVQMGAYRDPTYAKNMQAKLKSLGYPNYTEPYIPADGIKRLRVRAGPFPTRAAAEQARERMKKLGMDGLIGQKG